MSFVPSFEHYGTYDESEYPHLWNGRVGAWCPSVNPAGGTRLFDHSHYRNWGTLTNMDAATDWVTSGGRGALDFDGTNDRVSLENGNIVKSTGFWTISVWALARSINLERDIYTQKTTNTGYNRVSLRNNAGKMRIVATTAANEPTGAETILASTTSITTDVWQHWCAVITPGFFYIYLTGFLDNSSSNSFVTFASTTSANANIGQGFFSAGNNNLWNGQIDDLVIYDRALNSEEIRELYMLGRGGAYTPRSRMFYPLPPQQTFLAAWARRSPQLIGGGTL